MKLAKRFIFFLITAPLFAANLVDCSTPTTVVDQYKALLHEQPQLASPSGTTIFFLIDGFSIPMLVDALAHGRVENMKRFFHTPAGNFDQDAKSKAPIFPFGRASFPTLTYPNLTSILTGETVAQHPIIGNKILGDTDKTIDFEDVQNWQDLDHRIKSQTIFAKLRADQQVGVSYTYPFSDTTQVKEEENILAALAYAAKDYADVDLQTIESLKKFLQTIPPDYWPRFFFVHLIGVDASAHEFGPATAKTKAYIAKVDKYLAPIFEQIEKAEAANHKVSTILTADHGFVTIHHEIHMRSEDLHLRQHFQIVPDNRVASLFVKDKAGKADREAAAKQVLALGHVEWAAVKNDSSIELFHMKGAHGRIDTVTSNCPYGAKAMRFQWLSSKTPEPLTPAMAASPLPEPFFCADGYDRQAGFQNYSAMIPALVEYFSNPKSPDVVFVADKDSEFSGNYHGNHGGLTDEEVLVPLLTRHVDLPPTPLPTSQLLHYLHLF